VDLGGLISIWDPDAFNATRTVLKESLLIVEGVWVHYELKCYMTNVYAPQEEWKKQALWNSILLFMQQNPGMYIVFGDFNVVRNEVERIGSRFNLASATAFNNFILEGRFLDVPLGGHSFTRITSNGEKLS
ncbi:RNA-directed DNA polymerase, eukaryota, reverse transcriptase zinc-binding domain protein, partial [Tanacetum coccineum]